MKEAGTWRYNEKEAVISGFKRGGVGSKREKGRF
jgi:hypothetical protein